jgi:hypothetical protein
MGRWSRDSTRPWNQLSGPSTDAVPANGFYVNLPFARLSADRNALHELLAHNLLREQAAAMLVNDVVERPWH